jgi:hypothetical protein
VAGDAAMSEDYETLAQEAAEEIEDEDGRDCFLSGLETVAQLRE